MTAPSLQQLWKERAAETGKTDPRYLETKTGVYPPTYKFAFDWTAVGGTPMVKDWEKDGLWNERWYYAELLDAAAKTFFSVKKRMAQADRANAKRVEDWLKRVKAEEPSNELLSHYATYMPIIDTYSGAKAAGATTKENADADFEAKMQALSKQFYKVMNNGQSLIYDVRNDAWTKYEDCIAHYGHERISYYDAETGKPVVRNIFQAYKEWDSPTRYDTVAFNPRKAGHYGTTFNLWQGFSVQPEAGDDDLLVWDLLLRICDGNEAYFNYVQKWFAHMVQKPWELPGTCLGISGPQRMGKNTLVETFGMLLASPAMIDAINKHQTDTVSSAIGSVLSTGGFGLYTSYDQVFGTFNYSTGSKLLLVMDEATWSGSNALKARFKTAITGATTSVADKFVRSNEIANYRRYVLLSNNGDYLAVDPDDGRLLPLEFKAEQRPSKEWFDEFHEKRTKGKMLANLMHRLQSIDLTGWQPMQALREMEITTGAALQQASVPDYMHWIEDVAEHGGMVMPHREDGEWRRPVCGDKVSEDELKQSYRHFSGARNHNGWNKPDFVQLRDKVFGEKRQWRQSGGAVRGRIMPTITEMRERVEATSKWKYKRFEDVLVVEEPAKSDSPPKVVPIDKKILAM